MEEGNINNQQKADGKIKPGVLIAILISLLIIIVGLVIWIICNNMSDGGQKETSCEDMTDEYEMRVCLSHEESGENLDKRYDASIQKAYDEEKYELFNDLIMDRTSDLVLEDDCEVALKWIDTLETKYSAKLPILNLYGFYVSGLEVASECDSVAKETYYRDKIDEVMKSKEYSDAVAGDDYRIIGEDILNEDEGDHDEQ